MKVFFGEQGLTSTSANHIANIAKEKLAMLEANISNCVFYNTEIGLLSEQNTKLIKKGVTDITKFEKSLQIISEFKSLIAWLREAIKAKKELTAQIQNMSVRDYCRIHNIEYPLSPEKSAVLTEEEYYNSLSIKERNRYYMLETQAAVIGKFIHPDGYFAEGRKALLDKIQNPIKVDSNGRDTILSYYTPTVSKEEVETLFFTLQDKQREIQAQLNSIKFECESAIQESQRKSNTEFKTAYEQYSNDVNKIQIDFELWQKEELQKVQKLKILIPDSLKRIFDIVNNK
jgi:hypothetical protein